MPPLKLTVLDFFWPGDLAELVPELDALGYHRYWATEHHTADQSASPAIMTALAGGLCDRMRVGSAGVLLNLHSPLKVAEDFRLLELFFPGRVDLGIAGATAGRALDAALLDGRPPPGPGTYARRVRELTRLVRREPGGPDALDGASVGPRGAGAPDVWLCGTSLETAQLAGELGVAYAFHHQVVVAERGGDGVAIVRRYRDAFRPSAALAAPACTVVCFGLCAATDARVDALWAQHGNPVPRAQLSFAGTPDACRRQLDALAARYALDELVVLAWTPDAAARMEAYRLLAAAYELGAGARAG